MTSNSSNVSNSISIQPVQLHDIYSERHPIVGDNCRTTLELKGNTLEVKWRNNQGDQKLKIQLTPKFQRQLEAKPELIDKLVQKAAEINFRYKLNSKLLGVTYKSSIIDNKFYVLEEKSGFLNLLRRAFLGREDKHKGYIYHKQEDLLKDEEFEGAPQPLQSRPGQISPSSPIQRSRGPSPLQRALSACATVGVLIKTLGRKGRQMKASNFMRLLGQIDLPANMSYLPGLALNTSGKNDTVQGMWNALIHGKSEQEIEALKNKDRVYIPVAINAGGVLDANHMVTIVADKAAGKMYYYDPKGIPSDALKLADDDTLRDFILKVRDELGIGIEDDLQTSSATDGDVEPEIVIREDNIEENQNVNQLNCDLCGGIALQFIYDSSRSGVSSADAMNRGEHERDSVNTLIQGLDLAARVKEYELPSQEPPSSNQDRNQEILPLDEDDF